MKLVSENEERKSSKSIVLSKNFSDELFKMEPLEVRVYTKGMIAWRRCLTPVVLPSSTIALVEKTNMVEFQLGLNFPLHFSH